MTWLNPRIKFCFKLIKSQMKWKKTLKVTVLDEIVIHNNLEPMNLSWYIYSSNNWTEWLKKNNSSDCIDELGRRREIGETWENQRQSCHISECTEEGVVTRPRECLVQSRPATHCKEVWDGCCLVWDCSAM